MEYNVHDVFKKVVVYYTRKQKNVENDFLVMIWNSYHLKKCNTKSTRNLYTLRKLYLFKNDF
jgi:hypothetical protein